MEVKEGVMNDRIFELTKVKGTPEHIAGEIGTFVEENGPKALKQLERFLRQQVRYNQVMDIVEHERGFDPRREAEVVIGESHVALRTYDREIQAAIDAATTEPVLRCVDGCLWIYVDRDAEKRTGQKIEEFRETIDVAAPEALPWIERQFELTWSSFKEGRRQQAKPAAQRFLTIGSRVPRIALKDGNFIDGFSKLYRIYFDGIAPHSIIAQYIEALHKSHPARQAGETQSS